MSNATANSVMLDARGLHKQYRLGGEKLHVLRGVDMLVCRGEWLAILGRSGSAAHFSGRGPRCWRRWQLEPQTKPSHFFETINSS